VDLQARNSANAYGAQRSARMDFSEPDILTIADEDALNRALWHSIKGEHVPYPGIRSRALWQSPGLRAQMPACGNACVRSLVCPERHRMQTRDPFGQREPR